VQRSEAEWKPLDPLVGIHGIFMLYEITQNPACRRESGVISMGAKSSTKKPPVKKAGKGMKMPC